MNIIVCQSGGPTSCINASLCGVIEEGLENEAIDTIYGGLNGVDGIINDRVIVLNDLTKSEREMLKVTPSSYLGSCRHKLDKPYDENGNIHSDYQKILDTLKKYDITGIVLIGGNDSMDTVMKLSQFFETTTYKCNVIGCPKTIDNDLVINDHTPGYGSSIKFISTCVSELRLDTQVYEKGRVNIVEAMGRDTGWLAAGSMLAKFNGLAPDLIYLPEMVFDLEDFLEKVQSLYDKYKNVLVVVSEGIKNKDGKFMSSVFEEASSNDQFGHAQLGGVSSHLANIVKERLHINVRGIELNLLQRCASHILSKQDIEDGYKCGVHACSSVLYETKKAVVMKRISNTPYTILFTLEDVCLIANKIKYFPKEWILENGVISDNFLYYAYPLTRGNVEITYKATPKYLVNYNLVNKAQNVVFNEVLKSDNDFLDEDIQKFHEYK